MKQCPTCRLTFADENLRFCRFDGTPLRPCVAPDEASTMLFSTGKLNERFGALQEMRRRNTQAEK